MPLHRPDIPIHQTFILAGTGVKIAIRAFFPAEWYMDIDTQALPDRRLGRLFFAKSHNSSFSPLFRPQGRCPTCHTGLHSGCSVSVVTPCSGHGAKCLFFVQGRCPAFQTGLHQGYSVSAASLCSGRGPSAYSSSSFSTAIKASVGSCTLPRLRIFFLFPHKSFFLLRGPL